MALTKLEKERLRRALTWETAISHISKFTIPVDYNAGLEKDGYDRFMVYLIEWTEELLDYSQDFFLVKDTLSKDEYDFTLAIIHAKHNKFNDLQEDDVFLDVWWDEAYDAGCLYEKGKKVDKVNKLIQLENPSDADKKAVYNMFMPAYNAIKEKFDKRWWFEWFFNHTQYTVERDSLRLLKGVMCTLTGDSVSVIDGEILTDYRTQLNDIKSKYNYEIEKQKNSEKFKDPLDFEEKENVDVIEADDLIQNKSLEIEEDFEKNVSIDNSISIF